MTGVAASGGLKTNKNAQGKLQNQIKTITNYRGPHLGVGGWGWLGAGLGVAWGWPGGGPGAGLGVAWGGLGVAWGWPWAGLGVAWGWPGGGLQRFYYPGTIRESMKNYPGFLDGWGWLAGASWLGLTISK